MNNYEYIIAGLPDIAPDWKGADAAGVEAELTELFAAGCQHKHCTEG